MTERLRWGILATGSIAGQMTADLRVAGFPVVAVGSRSIRSAQAFAQTHGIPRAHGSYEELVADPEVDAVYVATPHPMHAENALLALDAGKHVLVEKPLALNAAQARRIADRAAERGLVALEAMWTRWLPHMVRIRELVRSGALGELRTLQADHGQQLSADPAGRLLNPALGGGALLDLGVYPLSFAWDILGAADRVLALASPAVTGVDATTSVLLGYPGGAQATLQCGLNAASPVTASIVGTRARIEIDSWWFAPTTFRLLEGEDTVLEEFDGRVPAGSGRQFQALELERLAASGATAGDILPPDESVAILGVLDEVRRQIGLSYPGE
ncbi:MAG TPA: Gfo/Idh/MocA family oxidoreductase [Microbacterium sp.]|nr:Gfo/Idh/MocA family oxidoreductase [Microbacterium sp.]